MDSRITDDLLKNKTITDVRLLRAIRKYEPADQAGKSDRQWELYNRVLKEGLGRDQVYKLIAQEKENSIKNNNDKLYHVKLSGKRILIHFEIAIPKIKKELITKLLERQLVEIMKTVMD